MRWHGAPGRAYKRTFYTEDDMTNAFERTIAAWAKETRESLDPRVQFLIREAVSDLYNGPTHPEDDEFKWPGFEIATREIAQALEFGDVWIDDNSESWTFTEPTEDECMYIRVTRKALVRALVGVELAQYL